MRRILRFSDQGEGGGRLCTGRAVGAPELWCLRCSGVRLPIVLWSLETSPAFLPLPAQLIAASHKQVEGQLEAPAQRLRHEKAGKRARIVKRGTVLGQGLAGLRGAMVEQEAAAQQAQRQRRRGDGGGGGDGGDQCSDGTAAAG